MAGKIAWVDLTIDNAEEIKTFYQEVADWSPQPVNMGEYNDFNMLSNEGEDPVAGICHARGGNAGLPPVWMIYITVSNLETALARCEQLGGKILKPAAADRPFAVIEDPAGAICTLYQSNK